MLTLQTTRVFERIAANHAYRIQVLQGGTSSSKTYSILQYLLWIAINVPGPLIISIVSETMPHLRRGAMRDFFRILGDAYDQRYHNKSECTYRIGQNIIEFFSADQPSRVRGPRRDILYVNEVNNVAKTTFEQLEIRTRLRIWVDYNPTAEFWVHEELLKRPDVSFDISTYRDNTFLDPALVAAIEQRRYAADGTEIDWWRVYGEGQIGTNQGCIYQHWTQCEQVPTGTITHGLDFGFTNDPTALVRVSLAAGELWAEELIYETGLVTDAISVRMDALGMDHRTSLLYADPSSPMVIQELRNRGWAIKGAPHGKDSIQRGIDYILSCPLHVTKDSLNMIKELRNYKWLQDRNGKSLNVPEPGWDHLMDGLRYAMSYKILNYSIKTARVRI